MYPLPYSSAEWGQKITRRKRKKKAVLTSSIKHQPYDDRKKKEKTHTLYWCPTLRFSCVTTRWTSHNCSSVWGSARPAFSRACSWLSSDSCLASSSSSAPVLSGSSRDQRDVAGFSGGTYLGVHRWDHYATRHLRLMAGEHMVSMRACASLCVCVHACVRAFMLYALNLDKYVFVENV